MPTHLEFADWVPHPLPRVFAFFSNPENLPRIMPPSTATKIIRITGANQGSTIVTSFRALPYLSIRAQWIARITEFESNHHFADVQDKGPFKTWHHRHEFSQETRNGIDGTLIRDVIDYEVGFGILGKMADALFIRRAMQSTFAHRQQALPKLL